MSAWTGARPDRRRGLLIAGPLPCGPSGSIRAHHPDRGSFSASPQRTQRASSASRCLLAAGVAEEADVKSKIAIASAWGSLRCLHCRRQTVVAVSVSDLLTMHLDPQVVSTARSCCLQGGRRHVTRRREARASPKGSAPGPVTCSARGDWGFCGFGRTPPGQLHAVVTEAS